MNFIGDYFALGLLAILFIFFFARTVARFFLSNVRYRKLGLWLIFFDSVRKTKTRDNILFFDSQFNQRLYCFTRIFS